MHATREVGRGIGRPQLDRHGLAGRDPDLAGLEAGHAEAHGNGVCRGRRSALTEEIAGGEVDSAAEDGNRGLDQRIDDPVAFADSIEKGLIRPSDPRYALKDKVITFYVNRAPYLNRDDQTFEPRPGEVFFTRSIRLRLDKSADDDPYQTIQRSVGGMEEGKSALLLRFSVMLRGRRTGSNPPKDTVYAPPSLARKTQVNVDQSVDVPSFIQGPDVAVEIEICDCKDCESIPGQGRCRRYPPINVIVPAVTADGSLSAHFEHTVAILENGPEILTLPAGSAGRRSGSG